jgi:excisionase family DNA binding protein
MSDWLTLKDAAQLAGYHADHLRTLIRQDRIKARKVVTVWLVSKSSLLAYLREQDKRGERRGRKP